MIKLTPTIVIGLLGLMASFAATSAMATDTRGAIKACDANPKCGYNTGEGDVVIVIHDGGGGGGGATVINCPIPNGECKVLSLKAEVTVLGPLVEELIEETVDDGDLFGMTFVNSGRVESACTSVSGAEFSRTESSYDCLNKSCAGPGTICLIYCADGKCLGGMPDRPASGLSLIGILQNGDNINRGTAPKEPDTGDDSEEAPRLRAD